MSLPLSLYLHIPFCPYRCTYCDFNTYTSLNNLHEAYTEGLAAEIALVARGGAAQGVAVADRPVRSIGFGGGTPSLLSLAQMARILGTVRDHFNVTAETAIAVEVMPETVDVDYLRGLRSLGVGRISIGAQSVVPGELQLLGREHDFAAVISAAAACRAAGLDNINLDMIYGVPGQDLASWERSLRAALALDTAHLSLYCLSVEPGTPMARWVKNGQVEHPDPDLAADQYALAEALLAEHGYRHYEISNWCRPGYESIHSLTYWRNYHYLGLGAGAHGFVDGHRYEVVKQPRVYLRRLQEAAGDSYPWTATVAAHHQESTAEAMSNTLLMQLRLLEDGLDLGEFAARFDRPVFDVYGATITELLDLGLLEQISNCLRLTPRGRFVSNQVFYRFFDQ